MWFGVEKFGEGIATGVSQDQKNLPREFALEQNQPNPFGRRPLNSATQIRFSPAATGWVSLKIYDLHGREVATLAEANMPATMSAF